jgi:hypothetical protein
MPEREKRRNFQAFSETLLYTRSGVAIHSSLQRRTDAALPTGRLAGLASELQRSFIVL